MHSLDTQNMRGNDASLLHLKYGTNGCTVRIAQVMSGRARGNSGPEFDLQPHIALGRLAHW